MFAKHKVISSREEIGADPGSLGAFNGVFIVRSTAADGEYRTKILTCIKLRRVADDKSTQCFILQTL